MPSKKSTKQADDSVATTTPATDAPKKKAVSKKKVTTDDDTETKTPVTRKPRSTGKVITKPPSVEVPSLINTNVVLNLKCSMADLHNYNESLNRMIMNNLQYNSVAPPEVSNYEDTNQTFSTFDATASTILPPTENAIAAVNSPIVCSPPTTSTLCVCCSANADNSPIKYDMDNIIGNDDPSINPKEIASKLKQLKIQLYTNSLQSEKKSACFWCTYDFDNMPCYIPKYEMDGTIYGYGSFCRPECAVAYLMKETIDDSTKFERYNLLNQIYSKVYNCKKNIKPAPDPHYLLDKFYGNMTIQEYRKLLKTEHLLLVVDKPFTRTLPELHEEIDDTFTKIYGIKNSTGNTSGVYKVKRQSEQTSGPTKASIVRNVFGLPTK